MNKNGWGSCPDVISAVETNRGETINSWDARLLKFAGIRIEGCGDLKAFDVVVWIVLVRVGLM